jgi:hypothetical protein
LSRLATSFVLGYHGCERDTAKRAIAGDIGLIQSDKPYDWIGPGIYFWESDPHRAFEWARERQKHGATGTPAVVGAVIDLGNCLDLVNREDLLLLKQAHRSFIALQTQAGLPIPKNKSLKSGRRADRHLRYLDCAVIRHLHGMIEKDESATAPYDTVRAMFVEGGKLFSGSGLGAKTHVQIAVRSNLCIKGLFLPRPDPSVAQA